jgi:hypothetical protein
MTGPRLFIILLIVIGLLCAVGIGVGLRQGGGGPGGGRAGDKPWVQALGGLGERFGPKVTLTTKRWTLGSVSGGASGGTAAVQTVDVQADPDAGPGKQTYRTLTLRLVSGGPVTVRFVPRGEGDEQEIKLPRKDADANKASLVVGAAGGTLTLAASGPAGAVVEVVE